jgi:hypothetical protein
MITVRSAELLIGLMTFLLANTVAITLAGAFRAWVAKKMGDDTADYAGFLTLNPLAHIDIIGIIFLLIFYFGWGRYIPINPFNIHGPYRRLKLFVAYLSDTFAYFLSALIGIIVLIITVGPQMLVIAQHMLICVQKMSHLYLITACPTLSSLTITLSFIVIAFVYLNVVLGVLNLILNSFSLAMYLIMERSTQYSTYNYYLIFLIPIFLILLFSEPLRLLAIYAISIVGYSISYLLGMV